MASPHWKPFQMPNNHENATNMPFGRSSLPLSSSSYTCSSNRNHSTKSNSSSSSSYQIDGTSNEQLSSSPGGASSEFREAGIVEKLLPSYGFIQCCERQARLFFHYSQFNGNIEHLKLGDPVEFEMTCDRRTGKPIASSVVKISSEAALIGEELSSEPVTGFITIEVTDDKEGRVAYESRGECFFLPFTKEDIVDKNVELKAKDSVIFHIATDKSGNLRARHISIKTPTPQRFEGVVCTLKDSFGFIERADIVKEIFFHSSECKDFKSLALGDDVEFSIQTRNNKEVAVNVTRLPPGSVIFEDVSPEEQKGQVLKTIERHNSHFNQRQHSSSNSSNGNGNEPFPGKIVYKKGNSDVEIPFGERDIKGEFSLQVGDLVKFNIVTDRRDKLKHATNVCLCDESFSFSGERRDQGYIAALKDSYGFIKCLNREGTRIYFKLAEMLDPNLPVKLNDEVEFTVAPDTSSPGRLQAIRIKALPNGTIMKNLLSMKQSQSVTAQNNTLSKPQPFALSSVSEQLNSVDNIAINGFNDFKEINAYSNKFVAEDCNDFQTQEFPLIDFNTDLEIPFASSKPKNSMSDNGANEGLNINSWSEFLSQLSLKECSVSGESSNQQLDLLNSTDCDSSPVLKPFQESFISAKNKREKSVEKNNERNGVYNIIRNSAQSNSNYKNGLRKMPHGFVVALKDSHGIIQSEDQSEVMFDYSVYSGNLKHLDIGLEVEYVASVKNSKLTADYVRRLPNGTITSDEHLEYTYKVVRSTRCLNSDQNEYWGIIDFVNTVPDGQNEFELNSNLNNINEFRKGDLVSFQFDKDTKKVYNVKRSKQQATVDSIKGSFGFLNFDIEEGKKLFFHMSEVKGDNTILYPGDTVEFVIYFNQRSGKYSACSINKLSDSQRPERLNRLKEESLGPKVVLLRQPKGPDGSKGFTIPRQLNTSVKDTLF
ncbi:cold shock domain-containing protein E1-like protein [Dinothrombium tinctorium]|uniref:Cold shock domain-containing protein E1-like protein n=1 Tax=Dinothrombium tinctorium TaxID=1965070 RepID=A0A443R1A3_9ACAR|nr:cold shock domain-containing protein E1-like protein [Dinothrombium tinctorium]